MVLATGLPGVSSAGDIVLAGESNDPFIYHVDPWTGREWFRGPFYNDFSGFTTQGVVALATDPTNREMYAVFETSEQFHRLVRYDARAFRAYDVGNLGQFIVGLAFDSAGTLYGISNDDVQGTPDTIFTIDKATAAVTFFMSTPGPDAFGDTIAFNPDDGKLYHWNGFPGSFNAIDLGSKTHTSLGVPNTWPAGVGIRSFTYDSGRGMFVGYRQQEFGGTEEYFTLTTGGVETALAAGTFDATGMAFYDEPALDTPAPGSLRGNLYGVDANINLISEVDPATGEDIASAAVLLEGEAVSGFNGIATDPTTAEIYAVARLDSRSQRLIIKVEPSTGEATLVGDTGEAIAGIAFDAEGTLYAITGDGGAPGSTLFTVDKSTGALTVFLGPLSANGSGEAIAFNSDDGRLYRFSGGTSIEAIDLDTLNVEVISLTGDTAPNGPPSGVVYDQDQGLFLAIRWVSTGPLYYSVSPAGAVTTIASVSEPRKGFAFSSGTALSPAISTPALVKSGEASGEETWAAITQDAETEEYRATVRRVSNSSQVSQMNLGADKLIAAVGLDDSGADSRLASLVVQGAATPKVRTYRLSDGALIRTTNVLQTGWQVFDLVALDDMNGDGVSEYAVLGRNSDTGENAAQVRSGADGAFIKNVFFLNASWQPRQLVALSSFAAGPAPELGLFATNDAGQIVVMVKDAGANAFIKNVFYLNSNWQPLGALAMPDFSGNSTGEIGMAAVNEGSGQIVLMVKDAATNSFLNNVFPLSSNFEVVAGVVIPDETSNGASEVAAMGPNKVSGKIVIQLRDGSSGVFIRNLFPLGSNWTPVDMLSYGGGASQRFLVSARRKSDGIQVVQILEGSSGALVGNVFLN